jgi:transitional endoplasmic reticulum ATPase
MFLFNKGQIIDNQYTVVFPHKEGAYAETYRVKDSSGKLRFLKLIYYSKLQYSQFDKDGSIIEVEITKRLNHPNICKYVNSGSLITNGQQLAYIVTEFVSGETLDKRIVREGELSVYEIKQVCKALLSAIQYLHNQVVPIIHNEITIQNLMLDLSGTLDNLKLIDFGYARFLNQEPARPNLKQLNPFYMAPERLNGVSSVQSDLFSVGAVLYQLIYGTQPWFFDTSGMNDQQIIERLEKEREHLVRIPEIELFEFDEQLKNLICKALSPDVEDRFQNANEFLKAINGDITIEKPVQKQKIKEGETKDSKIPRKVAKGEGFAAIAGMDELKDLLRHEVIDVLLNPEEYARYGLTIPNGMLLYGPPGCGKTFFAKHFAEEVGFNFMEVKPSTLKSKWVNATQENIGKMFAEAEENAPTIIFIDEMNELVPNRDNGNVHEMSLGAVNEMLAQMDRTGEKGIFIIGATNYPNMIDPAILRAGRLDKKYYLAPPDKRARELMLKLYLQKRPYDFGIDYNHLAEMTENYVSADLKLIVDDASRKALIAKSKITQKILEEVILSTRPSLNQQELQKYERIKAEMNGEESNTNKRPKIGF